MTATTLVTGTTIVTHTTIEHGSNDELSIVLKIDDDGDGTFVIEDFESIVELSVDDLDALVEMLQEAQSIRRRLDGSLTA